jgi:hypothetical protein
MCQNSSVSKVIGCGMGSLISFRGRDRYFPVRHDVQTCLGSTQPPVRGITMVLSLSIKWPEREAVHSNLSSYEVRNRETVSSRSIYAIMGLCLGTG